MFTRQSVLKHQHVVRSSVPGRAPACRTTVQNSSTKDESLPGPGPSSISAACTGWPLSSQLRRHRGSMRDQTRIRQWVLCPARAPATVARGVVTVTAAAADPETAASAIPRRNAKKRTLSPHRTRTQQQLQLEERRKQEQHEASPTSAANMADSVSSQQLSQQQQQQLRRSQQRKQSQGQHGLQSQTPDAQTPSLDAYPRQPAAATSGSPPSPPPPRASIFQDAALRGSDRATPPEGRSRGDTSQDDGSGRGSQPQRDFNRWPDGRQLVQVTTGSTAASAGGALSHALGHDRRAVVCFSGGPGGLKGLRVLTLGNIYMGQFGQAMSCVVDVKQLKPDVHDPMSERPQAGDISFAYRVMARSRRRLPHEEKLTAAMREAQFVMDMTFNVRQAWDQKGDVDEEQAYDLADTLYGALAAQQAELDAQEEEWLRQQMLLLEQGSGDEAGRRTSASAAAVAGSPGFGLVARSDSSVPRVRLPPYVYVTADLAQGLTTFTALGLLQRRLREEKQEGVVVEFTVYRASVAAPRLDGRDGWVFAIRLAFEDPYLPPGGKVVVEKNM